MSSRWAGYLDFFYADEAAGLVRRLHALARGHEISVVSQEEKETAQIPVRF